MRETKPPHGGRLSRRNIRIPGTKSKQAFEDLNVDSRVEVGKAALKKTGPFVHASDKHAAIDEVGGLVCARKVPFGFKICFGKAAVSRLRRGQDVALGGRGKVYA